MTLVKDEIRHKDYDLRKNIICLYKDEICVNGEVFNEPVKVLKEIIESYKKDKRIKRKKKNIVFVYDMFGLQKGLYDFGDNKITNNNGNTHSYETDNFLYYEFKVFDGELHPSKLVGPYGLKDGKISYIMYQFVKHRVGVDYNFSDNYSLTKYNMLKFDQMFTEEEVLELRREMNYHYVSEKEYLEDIYLCSARPNLNAKTGQVFYDVNSNDISSDYAAIMVYCDNYPTGKIYQVSRKNLVKEVIDTTKKNEWFLAVCKSEKYWENDVLGAEKRNDGFYYYGLTLYDIKLFQLRKTNIFKILGDPIRLYKSTKSGSLNKIFTDKLIECYNFKEDKNNSEVERHVKKIPLNTLYGYGMRKSLRTSKNLMGQLISDKPSRYLAPQMSYHTVAYARYYMEWMKQKFKNVVYNDTDCIKTTDENAAEIFAAENERIRELVKNRGYDSTIGQWKFEGKMSKFIAFAPKCYMYELDGNLECKFAGCREKAVKSLKNFDEVIENKVVPKGKPLGGGRYADYTLGKDCYM